MNDVISKLQDVASDLSELYIPTQIQSVDLPSSEKEMFWFYRTFVQKNIPVKIRGDFLTHLMGGGSRSKILEACFRDNG